MKFDVFISHASEDKEAVARPLAAELDSLGLRVWLDECQLTIGDSLRRKIDDGLSNSKFGVVILSHDFFAKEWPNKELDALVVREDESSKVILPIWHEITASDIRKYSPLLVSKLAVSTSRGLPIVAKSILEAIKNSENQSITIQSKVDEFEKEFLSKLRTQMLTADSARQLRQSVYELDEHLAIYPHSPEARLLKDQMVHAMRRAEEYERPKPRSYRKSSYRWLLYILALMLLGFLAYVFIL